MSLVILKRRTLFCVLVLPGSFFASAPERRSNITILDGEKAGGFYRIVQMGVIRADSTNRYSGMLF